MGSTPTQRPPSGEDSVATTADGAWYWDGTAWRRTGTSAWLAPVTPPVAWWPPAPRPYACPPAYRPARRRLHPALWLLLPLALLLGVAAEIIGRALARTVGVVVSIFALGATVAFLDYLFTH